MAERLHVAPRPCSTCPYRVDTPAGIWHESEYRKLPAYDRTPDGPGPLAVFHCHQEHATGRATVCRGWLAVHQGDATAVRLAVATGQLAPGDVTAPVDVQLYGSGAEACEAGLAGVEDPSSEAQTRIAKLVDRAPHLIGGDDA